MEPPQGGPTVNVHISTSFHMDERRGDAYTGFEREVAIMLTHAVFFRLKETTDANQEKVVDWLLNLRGKIPEIIDLAAGANVIPSDRAYDVGLIVRFEDQDAMQRYQVHPVHQDLLKRLGEVVSEKASVDFVSP